MLDEALGYEGGTKGPYRAEVSVESANEAFMKRRVLHFRLSYELFGSSVLLGTRGAGPASASGLLRRSKTLTTFWSTGLVAP